MLVKLGQQIIIPTEDIPAQLEQQTDVVFSDMQTPAIQYNSVENSQPKV